MNKMAQSLFLEATTAKLDFLSEKDKGRFILYLLAFLMMAAFIKIIIISCVNYTMLDIHYIYKVICYIYKQTIILKVTGNALNIEYYFWWRDYCFGLLIHHDAPFHFMVSISDEYKYKR